MVYFKRISIAMLIFVLVSSFVIAEPSLNFLAKECKKIGAYDPAELAKILGSQQVNWVDDKTLQIKAYTRINCADWVESGDFEIKGNKLILIYTLGYKLSEKYGRIRARCMCVQELDYTLKDLEKKEYQVEVQELETKNPKIEKNLDEKLISPR